MPERSEIAILLMAYGAAQSLDDIEPYLNDIRGGRPTSPELVAEVRRRYELMGGRSPLLEITRAQARALEERLNTPMGAPAFRIYIGMRHWHPYIRETVGRIVADGVKRVVALCLTPYYSRLSVGAYLEKLDEARKEHHAAFTVSTIESWNDQPALIEAFAEKVAQARDRFPAEIRRKVPILFTAHSLPERILKENDPYPRELLETVEAIVKEIGPAEWRFAYQSQGRTPEPWLGPEAGAVIEEFYRQGHRDLLMAPIGFISDHMETLYDVDILFRGQAESKGMRLERAASLNTSPLFIRAMSEVILAHLSAARF